MNKPTEFPFPSPNPSPFEGAEGKVLKQATFINLTEWIPQDILVAANGSEAASRLEESIIAVTGPFGKDAEEKELFAGLDVLSTYLETDTAILGTRYRELILPAIEVLRVAIKTGNRARFWEGILSLKEIHQNPASWRINIVK